MKCNRICLCKFKISEYIENSGFYDQTKKKIIGKMKDETKGVPIVKFVGHTSKMYSYVKNNEITCKKQKKLKKYRQEYNQA